MWQVPLPAAGDALVFDYRIRHRGLGNRSMTPRPLLYITFAKKEYDDQANFSRGRYAKLPAHVYKDEPSRTARARR